MNKSETIKELAIALSKAQEEMPVVEFNATNPFLKSKYADLGSNIKTATPVLAKYGLSISQLPTSDGDKIGLTTLLMHTSGEWIESTIMMPVELDPNNKAVSLVQIAGKTLTYFRRYSFAAFLGMYAEEDVDGNGSKPASKKPAPKTRATVTKKTNGKMSLEKAQAITTSKGEKYGDLETEKLSFMFNAITKSLGDVSDDTPADEIAELQLKRDAIKVILDSGK